MPLVTPHRPRRLPGGLRAIRWASAIRDAVRGIGIEIRPGLHTGEVEHRGPGRHRPGGARRRPRWRLAQPNEVLATSTVQMLALGSGISFADRALEGVPGQGHLFAVENPSDAGRNDRPPS